VLSVTDPYGRILGFLDRSHYFSIKLLLSCTHEAEWTLFHAHSFFFVVPRNRTRDPWICSQYLKCIAYLLWVRNCWWGVEAQEKAVYSHTSSCVPRPMNGAIMVLKSSTPSACGCIPSGEYRTKTSGVISANNRVRRSTMEAVSTSL
jgi:hypothetical protein